MSDEELLRLAEEKMRGTPDETQVSIAASLLVIARSNVHVDVKYFTADGASLYPMAEEHRP